MKIKSFSPFLAPNEEVDLSTLQYPLLASDKLDGIRCIFKNGEILSRSLKQIQNKQLRERFEPLRKFSESMNCILDGEIYSPELTFQEITHYVMTQDLESPKVGKEKGIEHLPDHLKFYCFDMIKENQDDVDFELRIKNVEYLMANYDKIAVALHHSIVNNQKEVEDLFTSSLMAGCEGLILRDPNGRYKYGRGTIKEGLIYKVKPFIDFDGQIIDVIQATEVNEDAEKTTNELGRSVTSKKKNDRHTIDKASAFMVYYNGKELKVTLSMTDEEKEEVWANRASYIGKWITYKGMLVGAKDVVRHPVMIRFREDK